MPTQPLKVWTFGQIGWCKALFVSNITQGSIHFAMVFEYVGNIGVCVCVFTQKEKKDYERVVWPKQYILLRIITSYYCNVFPEFPLIIKKNIGNFPCIQYIFFQRIIMIIKRKKEQCIILVRSILLANWNQHDIRNSNNKIKEEALSLKK